MEFNTSASVSIVSEEIWHGKLHSPALRRCKMELKAYSGHRLYIMGEADVNVQVNGQQKRLSFVVARDGGPPIFGRNWLMEITMAWKVLENKFTCRAQGCDNSIVALLASKNNGVSLDGLLRTYTGICQESLGKMSGIVAKIHMKQGARPEIFKPRPVPYALKDRIEQDLDRLTALGVIEQIPYSEWAAPIVPVIKANGTVRICGEFKVTINPWLDVEQYPLPRPKELFASLRGGKKFTTL